MFDNTKYLVLGWIGLGLGVLGGPIVQAVPDEHADWKAFIVGIQLTGLFFGTVLSYMELSDWW